MATVRVIDRGWKRISRELHTLERRKAQAGVWAWAKYKDGTRVLDAAVWAEYGTAKAPARPFMRYAADNGHADLIRYTQGQLVALYVSGLSSRGLLGNVAGYHVAQQRDAIVQAQSWAVPNAPSTVARKGFDSPLIETGWLMRAFEYRIV